MKSQVFIILSLFSALPLAAQQQEDPPSAEESLRAIPAIESSWDDLLAGVTDLDQWREHRETLRARFLKLLRDDQKPDRPPLDLQVHEEVIVDGAYRRQLISYRVEADERAYAYLGIPLELQTPAPAIVALHGTYPQGMRRAAGLEDNPQKAYLDHLCRRGYVVIAPEHFVSGRRIPPEGPYDTARFYERHPEWTAVGKFTYEHSIAIDVLESLEIVDPQRIGAMGHSLGGHGTIFLAAYDDRVRVAAANCGGAFFRHNPQVESWSRDRWYIYFKPLREDLLRGKMPDIDFHEIIALIAPRAFLDVSALNDGHPPTQRQRVLMLMKVMEVYDLYQQPEQCAFFVHGRGHAVPHESRQLIYGWLDERLRGDQIDRPRLVEAQQEKPVEKSSAPSERDLVDLEGWRVHVDPQLGKQQPEHRELALRMLANHLQRIAILVPEPALSKLRQVEFWLDRDHPHLNGMQYHPSEGWLRANGHDPRLAKKIHICEADQLYSAAQLLKHPACILHELAHAYHDQFLGFDHPEVIKAFERAKRSGSYAEVLLYTGKRVRHYGLNNHKEYFAEGTEAYFYRNDFYPFVRAELQQHDPELERLLQRLWEAPVAE